MGICCSAQPVDNVIYDDYVKTLPKMTGKVVAITGCTTGTGKVLAKVCASLGAKVVMLNRASERADDALMLVKDSARASGAPAPVLVPCDLMSFKSVKEAGAQLVKDFGAEGIDVLCNNAGIMAFKDKATEDGCDVQMQTNHLSHFLLTQICMPLLEKAASLRGEARVVNHSSALRLGLVDKGFVNDLQAKYFEKNGGNLGGDTTDMMSGPNFQRYQQTKLANLVFTHALHDRLQKKGSKVKALCAHPGVATTQLFNGTIKEGGYQEMPVFLQNVMQMMMMQSEADGAVGIIRQTCDPAAKSNDFFGPLGKGGATGDHDTSEYRGEVGLLKEEPLANAAAREMLWAKSEESTGVQFVV
eukprot:gb/GFBE01051586.1/.p1 GENE.gb/GFBE01051586.1/~~gb/GFBE01051586.1/.p1  ORF type:complete len:358 (+),score=95.95 gb/GFBE01051586.1/:1-1074(+)